MFRLNTVIFTTVFSLLFIGCAHKAAEKIDVSSGGREELYFTGRGSAAGMMMDSLLGGAGIAIGIAIDEGIAKDISSALQINNPKFSMDTLVKDVLREQVKQGVNLSGLKSIVIEKYGFQAVPDDRVVPLLELQLTCESGTYQKVKLVPNDNLQAISFEQVKTNGTIAEQQLRGAAESLLNTQNKICK